MKKTVFLIILIILMLSGCIYQAYDRPKYNDSEVWICKEPYAEFYWGDERWITGKMLIGENEYNIIHWEDSGAGMYVYEHVDSFKSLNDDDRTEYCLFYADVNYSGDSFTITVEDDYKNLFEGTYPTLHFTKHNIIDYFKDEK